MLNKIWPIFIIISFIFAIITGNINTLNNSIFNATSDAVQITITFFGTLCLWNGIMNILQKTSIMKKLAQAISPIMHFLFPEIDIKSKVYNEMTINVIANILGLGNAATPLGLKAMKTLQADNIHKDTVSDTMAMFIVLNTASLQLIPSTVIAIRSSLNSENPSSIIVPIWGATVVAAITGILATKILSKRYKQEEKCK